MPHERGFHCVRSGKGWAIHRSGAMRNLKVDLTNEEAWALTKKMAKEKGAVAWKHSANGRVMERIDFGPEEIDK